ncbi:MAG TPA: 2-oxoacid:ferredoxin oxidoreductase subunit beta [Chloroflexus aurantiacus]|jgi:2-oxoglutarate ferredoxin oxidoreductase subunit beta|uniref:Pyruvate ferredoxin/flavodoxin oxidoreductase, beta subunit n=1 Tax=Chloroflexus aurantiacus (strain ATCC 29366 / DSM 635 / J-10-fl) TaxID=324602 RepID=A9WHR7_CHLAA|nr:MULTISPECIES: 2-oxoacid:ferredoxin oxidoreductase subunit beta [Chloroflexus]ABY34185.1 pyruvate ferredoxin/flavodoxin oxidoreductase, beta subunit [Chloroflexus aurantiacus J-10-fl]RMG50300.1 MAG: 2-oxoacid:ferredoxin oxidoreductase subunit beta [Chloroflexota bacterium]GIV93541.1 MAG: 2-oxoglutarate synthase [Chloroflexus sp.]HBW67095.1 2-oxoacid:ferredoxin oxidoreductase subunit beta [Chloroflexus aurantiacus]
MTAVPVTTSPVVYKPSDYRSDLKPIWCPGCGDFGVLAAIQQALAAAQINPKDLAVVSGIGCSSRLPGFLQTYGLHTVHGRALPAAIGLKIARPDLTVMAVGGDGDFFSIGLGHLPHAARRDLDMTVIVMDNAIYGLTKGQTSPTSPRGHVTKSTPYGQSAQPLHPLAIVLSSGASFVARGFSSQPKQLAELIKAGLEHRGFAFIHVLSPCVTFYDTYKLYKELVYNLPDSHDPSDLDAAMRYAIESERLPLGIFFRRPPLEPLPRPTPKPFDTQEYLNRFRV